MQVEQDTLLSIQALTKSYDKKTNALDCVSLKVERGAFVSIIGSSGAGKSTLLRCVNRLVEPTAGSITFDGQEICGLRGRQLRHVRRRISMVFQHYNLVNRATAIENVLQGRLGYKNSVAGSLGLFSEEEKGHAFKLLEGIGLTEYAHTRVDQLSGGQKQRVGVARALVQDPLLILADEPISSLDPRSSHSIMDLLRWAVDELGVSCLVSLHQVEYALEYSDYIIGLAQGKLCCSGTPSTFDTSTLDDIYKAGQCSECNISS